MRRPEYHLSSEELASLRENDKVLESGEPEERQLALHLKSCEECQELAQLHRSLCKGDNEGGLKSADPCPDQATWLNFAAGLRPEDHSTLLGHAGRCEDCARVLKEAAALFEEPESDVQAPPLQSATPEWQLRLAKRMASSQSSAVSRIFSNRRASPRWTWVAVPIAAVLFLAAVLGGIAIWQTRSPSDEQLLARAYNKQRTLALRIPGSDPVPLASGTRGATGLDAPSELLELELRARHHLDQVPNDPYWHQVLGEISLLKNDGYAARRDLEIAQVGNPNLPKLQADLAAAWFEIGEDHGPSESYGKAAQLLSLEIQQHPHDSVLLYNRALCWSRLGLNQNAVKDLKEALLSERSATWRRAIESEIQQLSGRSRTDPSGGPAGSVLGSDDDYESSLMDATEQLLPRWGESQSIRNRLGEIARRGLLHQDQWLRDWIAGPHSSGSERADRLLSIAVREGARGDASNSLSYARQAIEAYRDAGSSPGGLRAELAVVYALQRLDRSTDCLASAASLKPRIRDRAYSWMAAQLALEIADCEGMSGDFKRAQQSFSESLAISERAGLIQLKLRAMGSEALLLDLTGKPMAGWDLNAKALKLCIQNWCPPLRHYQLLDNLAYNAAQLELPSVAAEAMATGVEVASKTADVTTLGYALETLAAIYGRNGQFRESSAAFQDARNVMQKGLRSKMPDLYEAEWNADRAEILLREGRKDAALDVLREDTAGIGRQYQVGHLRYLEELSAAELATGNTRGALKSAWAAVDAAEQSLPSIRGSAAKEQWQHENGPAYVQLVKAYLRAGQVDQALLAWERFRGAPLGKVQERRGQLTTVAGSTQDDSDVQVIIVARLEDEYAIWLARRWPVRVLRMAIIRDGANLRRLAITLHHLCADRGSAFTDVEAVAEKVYDVALKPVSAELSDGELWFDLDPSIELMPVSALRTPDGRWLGIHRRIAVAPRAWTVSKRGGIEQFRVRTSDGVLVIDGSDGQHASTGKESTAIAELFPRSRLLDANSASESEILRASESAKLLHFTGHATSDVESQLVLGGSVRQPRRSLTAEQIEGLQFKRCEMAVLAACNTSAASPDRIAEIPDLRDALLRSGVQTVVASSWDVDDQSTKILMMEFYRHIQRGHLPAESLRASEEAIQSLPRWKHPFYWASFEVFLN